MKWIERLFAYPDIIHNTRQLAISPRQRSGSKLAGFDYGISMDELIERFWQYVHKGLPDECWPWMGSCGRGGYGKIKIHHKIRQAHRIAYEISIGPIPPEMHIIHSCDNPACCNPAHLIYGTRSDNMRDMIKKGRGHFSHPSNKKLDDEKVRDIRLLYKETELPVITLASLFNCSARTIRDIVNHKSYKNVNI